MTYQAPSGWIETKSYPAGTQERFHTDVNCPRITAESQLRAVDGPRAPRAVRSAPLSTARRGRSRVGSSDPTRAWPCRRTGRPLGVSASRAVPGVAALDNDPRRPESLPQGC